MSPKKHKFICTLGQASRCFDPMYFTLYLIQFTDLTVNQLIMRKYKNRVSGYYL